MHLKLTKPGKIYLISDEHYAHKNIILYDNRPFADLDEMREIMIKNHNEIVTPVDTTFHLGDFCLSKNPEVANKIISRLNGNHFFIKGSHDYWLPEGHPERYEFRSNNEFIVIDHHQMSRWPRDHYGSIHFFGHQHGRSKHEVLKGNKMEVFCGDFNYTPVYIGDLIKTIKNKPDYFTGIKNR